jgi:translation elongation factor EF-Tu-like GTPase
MAKEVSTMAEEKLIGKITHYFGNINVGIIGLTDSFRVGDKIHVKGLVTDFEQAVDSMQIDRKDIGEAKSGAEVGVKLEQKVREGDMVYKVL